MLALKRSTWLMLLLALAACVTVNIYFPAAAAEKAADQIIDSILQGTPQKTDDAPSASSPSASNKKALEDQALAAHTRGVVLAVLRAASASAQAQNINFNASSPEISAITAKMAARTAQLRPHYASGAVGFAADGYIVLRDAAAVAMAERGKVQQLVAAENADRKALYQAIAAANGQPSWFDQIRQVFAKRWIEQAERGWWVESGGWKQK